MAMQLGVTGLRWEAKPHPWVPPSPVPPKLHTVFRAQGLQGQLLPATPKVQPLLHVSFGLCPPFSVRVLLHSV